MPKFSNKSKKELSSCDERIQEIFNEVIKFFDCTIIQGYRNKELQNDDNDCNNNNNHQPYWP